MGAVQPREAQSSLALRSVRCNQTLGLRGFQHLHPPFTHKDGDVLCLPGSLVSAPGPRAGAHTLADRAGAEVP